jgi:nucleoside-diphosphate-sugar epimerase
VHLGQDGVVNDHRNLAGDGPGRSPGRVRSRRTPATTAQRGLVVAVTGAASGAGASLVDALAERSEVRRIVAVDDHRGERKDVTWRILDVREPALVQRLAGCDVVVHAVLPDVPGRAGRAGGASVGPGGPSGARDLARARLVDGARTVLTAAAAAGVARAVLVTSAMVYGAARDNPVPLDEDAPLRADADGSALDGLLEVEEIAASARTVHPGLAVTVLRPAILAGPGVDSVFSRHFMAPRLLVVKDSRPHWQFCHVDDLTAALVHAVLGEVTGDVTVASAGFLTQAEVEAISGLRRIELPARIAFGTAERLHRLGISPAPPGELAYTAEPWVVPSTKLLAAGWRPGYDNARAFAALLAENEAREPGGRRFGRDATLGAAGATVAVLGTAAVVRQIRRQRRGT